MENRRGQGTARYLNTYTKILNLAYLTQQGGRGLCPLTGFRGVPQYCSNKNTSSIRDRKKGRKEDKEAVQMAYSSHHHNPERKDMPHGRNDSREWVARQGLPPDRYGIAARSDSTKPDRRAFGDLPDVGRTRAKNEYGDHRVLADCLACVSQLVSTESVWQTGERSAHDPRRCSRADPCQIGFELPTQPIGK